MEERECTDSYDMVEAPCVNEDDLTYTANEKNREIRVYHQVNARLTMQDFYAKLAINYGRKI